MEEFNRLPLVAEEQIIAGSDAFLLKTSNITWMADHVSFVQKNLHSVSSLPLFLLCVLYSVPRCQATSRRVLLIT